MNGHPALTEPVVNRHLVEDHHWSVIDVCRIGYFQRLTAHSRAHRKEHLAVACNLIRTDRIRPTRNYLRKGDPCRITGERGVFRFVAHVLNADTGAEWIEVVGPDSNPRTRSFRPDRLRRVARSTPTRHA